MLRLCVVLSAVQLVGSFPTALLGQITPTYTLPVTDEPLATWCSRHGSLACSQADPLLLRPFEPAGLADFQVDSRPSRGLYLAIGGAAGALIGLAIGAAFESGYCSGDEYSCSANGVLPGLLIGGGVGILAGWITFEIRNSADPPRAAHLQFLRPL